MGLKQELVMTTSPILSVLERMIFRMFFNGCQSLLKFILRKRRSLSVLRVTGYFWSIRRSQSILLPTSSHLFDLKVEQDLKIDFLLPLEGLGLQLLELFGYAGKCVGDDLEVFSSMAGRD